MTIPTTTAIKAQIIADIEAALGQTTPLSPKSAWRVLAGALAGALSLGYRFALWAYRQIFAATADEAALIARGAQYGLAPSPAVAAILTAAATGTTGVTIPAGTLWAVGTVVYSQTADVDIALGTATVEVECLTAGDAGNLTNGETIALASPIAGVDAEATIASTVTTGEDEEDIESFRAQVQEREARRPQGGAAADYVQWALEVPGVVKAFAHRITPGYATVYPLVALTGAVGERLPDASKIAEVLAYLSDLHRKPLQSTPIVAAMTEVEFDVTITDLDPDTPAIRAAIEAALEAYLLTRYPKQYPDETAPTDVVSTAALSGVAVDAGMQSGVLTMEVSAVPLATRTLAAGELAIIGTVTWA